MRLDQYLVEIGMFDSRSKAQAAIKSKAISVDGKIRKSSFDCSGNEIIEKVGFTNPYVSRSGLKLDKAIKDFSIDMKDKIILDVGSSTGGFTEVSLLNGAKTVYSVDVGSNQMVDSVKKNNRVILYENTNILDVDETFFNSGSPDMIVMDVSFVSITKIIPHIKKFTRNMVVLIKPQFESKGKHLHKGVIKDKNIRKEILDDVLEFLKTEELVVKEVIESPIQGKEGNIEYIAYIE